MASEQAKLTEAIACYQQALHYKPDLAKAHSNMGMALAEQGKLTEAIACYQQALRYKPDYIEAHSNSGVALVEQGKLTEAEACYEQAIRQNPVYAAAHMNLAQVWLLRGEFEKGWPEYEWRWKHRGFTPPPFTQPVWDGSTLEGQTILLYPEQGLGDTIQFIRYAPFVQQRGGTVIAHCQVPLQRLLANFAGIDRLVLAGTEIPDFDIQAPLLSLPHLFVRHLRPFPPRSLIFTLIPNCLLGGDSNSVTSMASKSGSHGKATPTISVIGGVP